MSANLMLSRTISPSSRLKNFLLPLFLIGSGFWTLKLGPLSYASFAFLFFGLINIGLNRRDLLFYGLLIVALCSHLFTFQEFPDDSMQYSILFGVVSVIYIYIWTRWCQLVDCYISINLITASCYIALLITFVGIALLSPDALYMATEGQVGFFNEKGIVGQYVAILCSILLVFKKNRLNFFLFIVIAFYCTLILESGRAVVFYAALFLLYIANSRIRINFRIYFILIIVISLSGFLAADFIELQLYKVTLLLTSDLDLVGRYAASYLVRESSFSDLFFGHGFGSYLRYRASELPLFGMSYDYPGSVLIELIFEVGFVFSLLAVSLVSRLCFRSTRSIYIVVTLLALSFGVKHDATTFLTLLALQMINNCLSKLRHD